MEFSIWDQKSPVCLPDGQRLGPEEFCAQYPLAATVPYLLGRVGGVVFDADPLPLARMSFGISEDVSDEEAARAIGEMRNAPPQSPQVGALQQLEQHVTEIELMLREGQRHAGV